MTLETLREILSETPTLPNTPPIDISKYISALDLEAILDARDHKFLEVLAIIDRQIHEEFAIKKLKYKEELAIRDANIELLNQKCAMAEQEL